MKRQTKKPPTAAEVRKAERELSRARAVIAAAEDAENVAFNAGLVGIFFKYRNSYSCPRTEADYWWLYRAVTDMDEHGTLIGWSFQTDSAGKHTVEPSTRMLGALFRHPSNYVPIKASEFYGAFAELQSAVALMARQEFKGRDEAQVSTS